MGTRLRNCDETIVKGRLAKAEQFLDAAATVRDFADDEADVGDALVTLCVHAGIAAARLSSAARLSAIFVRVTTIFRRLRSLSKVTRWEASSETTSVPSCR